MIYINKVNTNHIAPHHISKTSEDLSQANWSLDNIVDLFTKSLSKSTFQMLVWEIGMLRPFRCARSSKILQPMYRFGLSKPLQQNTATYIHILFVNNLYLWSFIGLLVNNSLWIWVYVIKGWYHLSNEFDNVEFFLKFFIKPLEAQSIWTP